MTKEQLIARRIQRLTDKVKIRVTMVQKDFDEMQREFDYHAKYIQMKPLVDPDTGLVYQGDDQDYGEE